MRLEVKKMNGKEEAELAEIITKLIQTNGKVRSAVMNAAYCCPNIVTQY